MKKKTIKQNQTLLKLIEPKSIQKHNSNQRLKYDWLDTTNKLIMKRI